MKINKSVINLLESAHPFMGEKGKNLISFSKHFSEMLESEPAHQAFSILNSVKLNSESGQKKEGLVSALELLTANDQKNSPLGLFGNSNNLFPIFLLLLLLNGSFN